MGIEKIEKLIEYTAHDIYGLILAIDDLHRRFRNDCLWWRGQEDYTWSLLPLLFRSVQNGISVKDNYRRENNLIVNFCRMARTRYANCPDGNDFASWLFLMQHYGLPTRLLDWSESPLVSLFFAVESESSTNDAVLWCIHPAFLSLTMVEQGVIFTKGSARNYFAKSFDASENYSNKVISVMTEQIDSRHLVQQSMFTLHDSITPLEDFDDASKFMVGIRIPGKNKELFRRAISILGISRATLFPDLENLAKYLSPIVFKKTDKDSSILEKKSPQIDGQNPHIQLLKGIIDALPNIQTLTSKLNFMNPQETGKNPEEK